MKVYIAITGIYENTWPSGVYASPEEAMAAHDKPGTVWTQTTWAGPDDVPAQYAYLHSGRYTTWTNNHDWDSHVAIHEFDLEESGSRRAPDKVLRQVYRESDGGWDYVESDPAA